VTLCEAYIGIELPLNLWSHLFRARLRPNLGMRVASLGSVDILVCTGPGSDSYFSIPQPNSPVGWRKAWFLLKNEADTPLPVFTSGCPVPHLDWEHGMTRIDFPRLQPVLGTIWVLQQKGLTGEGILRLSSTTGFSRFTSERRPWGHRQGPAASFAPPSPVRML
jgi:hypothetical protein